MMGGHFTGMDGGPGHLDLDPTSCDGAGSGTVATHMQWNNLDTTTGCVDGLDTTMDFSQCAPTADQSMHGMMGLTLTGTTCDPTAIDMNFSGVTVTTPDGTVSGNFSLGMGDIDVQR